MRYVFTIAMFLIVSCEVVKKRDRSSSRTERHARSEIQINHEKDIEKIRTFDETITLRSSGDFFTEIVPRGSFTITPEGNFSGEAESVKIYGSRSEQREETRQSTEKGTDKSTIEESNSQRETTLEKTKDKTVDIKKKPSIKGFVGLGIAILVVIIGLALARKFKII